MDKNEIYLTLVSITHNPLYVKRYIKFLSSIVVDKDYEGRLDRHHILPKSLWPDYQDLRSNKWNMIRLTPRQHYIAHWLLAKAFGDRMWFAFHRITHSSKSKIKISSKAYEAIQTNSGEAYKRFSQLNYGVDNLFQSEVIKKKIKETNLTRYGFENPSQSEEIKQKKILTTIENYGVLHHNQLIENRDRISERTKLTREEELDKVCEFCGKSCKALNYKRWHGTNCKSNPNESRETYSCEYCPSITDNKGMFKRWHGENCKFKTSNP